MDGIGLAWFLAVLIGCAGSEQTSLPLQVCKQEFTDATACPGCLSCVGCIGWPDTVANQCTYSTLMCLNHYLEPVQRCCKGNAQYAQWDPVQNCYTFQQIIPQCPDGFTYNSQVKLCYKKYTGSYPLDCPYEETVPFETYKTLLDTDLADQGPFWMPVRRTEPLGYLTWIEASPNYKKYFQDKVILPERIVGQDCLLYHNLSTFVSAKCNETHAGICAYAQLTTVKNKLCYHNDGDLCRQSDFSTRSKCFCAAYNAMTTPQNLVAFLQPYQNLIYPTLTDDACMIGLFQSSSMYMWSSGDYLNYTNWSEGAIFNAGFNYGSVYSDGWRLEPHSNTLSCFLYEKDVPQYEPKLHLQFDAQQSKFVLTIDDVNGLKHNADEPLVFCFTDASSYELVYKYPSLTQDGASFIFGPHAKGPGTYWCEAFKYPDLDAIRSNEVFYKDPESGSEFVTVLRFVYVAGTDILSQDKFEFFERVLFIQINNDHLESRIMKILALDEDANQVTFQVHLSSKIKRSDIEVEFTDVRGIVLAAIDEVRSLQLTMDSFLSSEYCIAETVDDGITWDTTPLGSTGVASKMCFSSGKVLHRKCIGSFMDGARWEDVPKCEAAQTSEVTDRLLDVLESNGSVRDVIKRTRGLSERFAEYVPLDVFLLSGILEKSSSDSKVNLLDLVDIIDNVHRIQNDVLGQSQIGMQATDRILHYVDKILLKSSVVGCADRTEATTLSELNLSEFNHPEVKPKRKWYNSTVLDTSSIGTLSEVNLSNTKRSRRGTREVIPDVSQIAEASLNIGSGTGDLVNGGEATVAEPTTDHETTPSFIALDPCIERSLPHIEIHSENFMLSMASIKNTNITGLMIKGSGIKYLYQGEKLPQDLELAVVFNDDLRSAIIANGGKVIIAIYTKDALFNENSRRSVSKIVSVLLPGLTTLTAPLTIVFNNITATNKSCSFWSYDQNTSGTWYSETPSTKNQSLEACDFWHTTHFALLLAGSESGSNLDGVILEIITNISCGLSVFGLVSILLTAFLFRRWRRNTGNQILINFSVAIFIEIAAFYASNAIKAYVSSEALCTIIGIVLHYSLISQFCWMFIIAVLQFRRFVEVLGGPPKYVLLKACLCGWVLPLLPVLCVYFLDQKNYVSGHVGLCYPSGLGLYLGVWLPIAIIVAINFVIFLYIIYNVVHRKTESTVTVNNDLLFQWRLGILLFFMLGLTWSFGLLTELNFGIVFVYLFCITAPGQGFVMFLFFIVFNRSTRFMYVYSVKSYFTDSLSY